VSPFTLAYLARLEVWGLAAAVVQGGLVLGSWRAWARATASAAPRYRLACAHFAALAVLPALTVMILQATLSGLGPAAATGGSAAAALPWLEEPYQAALRLALPLAGIWMVGAGAMILGLARDAGRIARLGRGPAPGDLAETVRRLARGWPVPEVRWADVPAPQIVGLRRPVLLTPPDLALRLSPVERDAVLLHELAHVRRGDFGWNLVQRLVLALLWFHPAAWALYGALSREREVCCDALAVGHGASAADLARGLVRLAETQGRPGLAMAASSRGDLTTRVRLLLEPEPPGATPGHRRALAVGASALCILALGAGGLGVADPAMGDLYAASAFGPTISISARDPSGAFALQVRHGRVIAASLGTQRLGVRQLGDRVTLVGASRRPVLALTVTPQGRIRWKARS
jgi:beta-lactamase regulating signal transducer with metallopeptidase domain